MANYVDPKEFRVHWTKWTDTGDKESWDFICDAVYKICHGVSTRFNPKDKNEHDELTHHAFAETIAKIKNGREGKIPKLIDNGKSSPFNLITTAASNTLYTLMKRRDRQRFHYNNYRQQQVHHKKHISNS